MVPAGDPVCPACSKPVISGTLVVFEHGELYHVRCRARATALRSAEEADRAEESRARAADAVTRATRLIEEVRGRRESGSPAAGRPEGSS